MFLPLHVDVPEDRAPWANRLICLAIVVIYILTSKDFMRCDFDRYEEWMLHGWRLKGFIGHIWLHADLLHLIGNLIFLWLFGNAVCAKVGNFRYLVFYLTAGFFSGLFSAMLVDIPSLGASGAINGIVGMYLVFFPANEIEGYWMYGGYIFGHSDDGDRSTVSGYFIIPFWFALDLFGVFFNHGSGIGYIAHVAGFITGFTIAILLLVTKNVKMESCERSLLHVIKHGKTDSGQLEVSEDLEKVLLNRGVRASSKVKVKASSDTSEPAQIHQQIVKGYTIEDVPDTPFYAIDQNDPSRESWVFNVPDPKLTNETLVRNGLIYFSCACGKRVKMPMSYAGKKGRCPHCNNVIHIPKLSV